MSAWIQLSNNYRLPMWVNMERIDLVSSDPMAGDLQLSVGDTVIAIAKEPTEQQVITEWLDAHSYKGRPEDKPKCDCGATVIPGVRHTPDCPITQGGTETWDAAWTLTINVRRLEKLEQMVDKHEAVLAILMRGGESNEMWSDMVNKWHELTPKEVQDDTKTE